MGSRKHRLADCNPHWVQWHGKEDAAPDAIYFECPEGHDSCKHVVPFTPALDGSAQSVKQFNGAQWQRTGDSFETLTLSPSIRRIPRHANREAAIAAGCLPEHITETLFCALHIFIRDGRIEFCGDSR